MTQYIEKSALLAEIEKQIELGKFKCQQSQENGDQESYIAWSEHIATCEKILSFVNTLEVKEVDLEEEICSFFSKNPIPYEHITDWPLLKNCAIHFFELGLKAQKGE